MLLILLVFIEQEMDKSKLNRISTIKKESLELELVDETDEHEHSSSNSFDLIYSRDTILHIQNKEALFALFKVSPFDLKYTDRRFYN